TMSPVFPSFLYFIVPPIRQRLVSIPCAPFLTRRPATAIEGTRYSKRLHPWKETIHRGYAAEESENCWTASTR
ncbi:MAG: hypothetical protein WCC14_00735, partial [Acidobacteriaceae bacterium]